jgi:enterochelin esterase family protein
MFELRLRAWSSMCVLGVWLLACGSDLPKSDASSAGNGGETSASDIDAGAGAGGANSGSGGGGTGGSIARDGGVVVGGADAGGVELDDAGAIIDASYGFGGNQGDPGNEDDGRVEQPGPYEQPIEALGPLEGPGTRTGPLVFQSAVYGYGFEYYTYVPPEYDPARPAALMVFQDGVHYLGLSEAKFNSPQVWDKLIKAGEMPVTIGLFINPGEDRSTEYNEIDDTYARFIDEIVAAVVLSQYNIIDDADGWAIGGHSSGGIAAFTVAWHHPGTFHKVLTHNGSFTNLRGGHVYPDLIRDTPRKPLRVYLLSGTNDINAGEGGDRDWLLANDNMAEALDEMGYHYRYLRGEGEHYPPLQAQADYPAALRWLWKAYKLPE